MSNNITNVKIVRDPFYKRIIKNPMKYYFRASGFTFCLVSISNLTTSLFNSKQRESIVSHPQYYFSGLALKSAYFGVLWPSFYITAIKNPRDAFIFAHPIDTAIELGENAEKKRGNGKSLP